MTKFVNPENIVGQSGLMPGQTVADLGCGAGFYTIAAAKILGDTGMVYAIDVQESKLTVTQSSANQAGCKNVAIIKADLEKPLTEPAEGSCDMVILASILHEVGLRDPLIKNAYRLLKTGGKLLAVEWKKQSTPLGPPVERRIAQEDLIQLLERMGFHKQADIPADSFHYAMVCVRQ